MMYGIWACFFELMGVAIGRGPIRLLICRAVVRIYLGSISRPAYVRIVIGHSMLICMP